MPGLREDFLSSISNLAEGLIEIPAGRERKIGVIHHLVTILGLGAVLIFARVNAKSQIDDRNQAVPAEEIAAFFEVMPKQSDCTNKTLHTIGSMQEPLSSSKFGDLKRSHHECLIREIHASVSP